MPPATLKLLASATGFSITPLSRALAGYSDVRDSSRQQYDDIPAIDHPSPPLTTVRQPIFAIGRLRVHRLLSQINDPATGEQHALIPPKPVVRTYARKSHVKGGDAAI